MTLELTHEQRQRIQQQPDEPVEIIDPDTQRCYVLIAREQYDKVRALLEREQEQSAPLAAVSAEVSPTMLRSQQAFWRDLPDLLKNKTLRKQKACYHGDQRIATGRTSTELVQHCLKLGLHRGDFYIGWIEEQATPPWEGGDIEESLYEVTDEVPVSPPLNKP